MSIEHLPEDLLGKLTKLKNLRDGAAAVGSMEESANAAGKLQELLLKHNLDEQELNRHNLDHKIQMLMGTFNPEGYRLINSTSWVERLVSVLAKHCMCRIVLNGKINYVLGEKQNVATVFYMVDQLAAKISNALHISWHHYTGPEKKGAYSRAFLVGCVDAISSKMYETEREIKKANTEMGLMLVSKMASATRFMEDKFPSLRKVAAKGITSSGQDGYARGHAAGSKMDVNKGVGGTGGRKQIGN